MKNHYDILGISRDASPEQIKTAYRKLSIKFHPDKNQGEEFFSDMFKQINEAYTILYNPNSRKVYDIQLYKFEHPDPIYQKVYQEPKPTTQPNPSPKNNYSEPEDKWVPVRKWREKRNILLIVNIILISIAVLFPKKKNNSNLPPSNAITYKSKEIIRHHKRKHQIAKPIVTTYKKTVDSLRTDDVSIYQSQIPSKNTDTNKILSAKSSIPTDTLNKINTHRTKKRFFKRLFGKKKNDTT